MSEIRMPDFGPYSLDLEEEYIEGFRDALCAVLERMKSINKHQEKSSGRGDD